MMSIISVLFTLVPECLKKLLIHRSNWLSIVELEVITLSCRIIVKLLNFSGLINCFSC